MTENVRVGSNIPVSCHDVVSCVLPINMDRAWGIFKSFKLEFVIPQKVKSTEYLQGGANQIESIVRVKYFDGAVWDLRISEISDLRHSIAYQVIKTEPVHAASSIIG